MLFNTGGDRKNIRIEDDVFGREPDFVDQQTIGALANFRLARKSVGLPLLIKRHHDHGRAIAAAERGLP